MINIRSRIKDQKINAVNVLVEIPIKEYLPIAKEIIKKNDLQRKRIKSSKTVYSLLRQDLSQGCTIPPIFLAVNKDQLEEDKTIDYFYSLPNSKIIEFYENNNLLILDGLQRTLQMIDLEAELIKANDTDSLDIFLNQIIRCETYIGINKVGILYRMLTLNSGQTPMSMRHQVEIIYKDYIGQSTIDNIELFNEVDTTKASEYKKYRFNEIIDGFQSYLNRSELQLDKDQILDDIKSLQKLSNIGKSSDVFKSFVMVFDGLIGKIIELSNNWEFDIKESDENLEKPFGKNANSIFIKSQAITGFGAAIGILEDMEIIKEISDIINVLPKLEVGNEDVEDCYIDLLKFFEKIRQTAKKIGNSQRRYFYHFFKALLNDQLESYLNISNSIAAAENMYKMEFA